MFRTPDTGLYGCIGMGVKTVLVIVEIRQRIGSLCGFDESVLTALTIVKMNGSVRYGGVGLHRAGWRNGSLV